MADLTKDEGEKPRGKATFYSRDPDRLIRDKSNPGKKKYLGFERRRGNRRKSQDRRVDVRFDLNKTDRRDNNGRRDDDDKGGTFW